MCADSSTVEASNRNIEWSDELPKHEKIRFRRDEITDLGAFPSAAELDPRPRRRWLPARARKILLATFAGAAGLVLLLVLAVYAIGVSGFGSEQLRVAAERNLEKFAGFDITASVGPARITFDASRFLALEVRDVSLKHASDGSAIADAGMVRFGVRLLPLLSGRCQAFECRPFRGTDRRAARACRGFRLERVHCGPRTA